MVLTPISKDSDEHKILNRLYRLDARLRGKFLLHFTSLEDMIDKVIATHFFPQDEEKYAFFGSLILREINSAAKIKIFLIILETHYPEIYRKQPLLKKHLENIRIMRNTLTHSFWYTKDDFLKKNPLDKIALETHKKGKIGYIEITKKEIDKKISIMDDLVLLLDKIDDHVKNKKHDTKR